MARTTSGRSRAGSKINNRPTSKVPSGAGSISTLLTGIVESLNLDFDSSVGILSGDNVMELPELDQLSMLRKSLLTLKTLMDKIVEDDDSMVLEIDTRLKKRAHDDEDMVKQEAHEEEILEDDDESVTQRKKKRTKLSNDDEDLKSDDDDIPLASIESRKPDEQVIEAVKEEPNEANFKHETEEQEEEYHTPESVNDTRVKNPKSEFVTSQTLPAALALLGLFSEETGGLDTTGEEYLKKKYAVASYPTRDLKDMLPGPIPNVDFSKNKPSNQVQFTTFQGYTDIYFKNYSDEDIKFLKETYTMSPALGKNYDPQLQPFFIPKLGTLYTELWNQEEPLSGVKLSTPLLVTSDNIMPKGSLNGLTDEVLETDQVSCGPLVSRLLSLLLPENPEGIKEEGVSGGDGSSTLFEEQGWNVNIVELDYSDLEQRLRRELKYVGVYMNVQQILKEKRESLLKKGNVSDAFKLKDEFQEDWISGKEDDEICKEIRSLQKSLVEINRKNNKRKTTVIPIVEEQIAWQEYLSILEDLDKQIDQLYIKRMRVPKKQKKRANAQVQLTPSLQLAQLAQLAQQLALNSGLKSLLDKRLRWIEKIGPLFKPVELMRRVPSESIFKDVDLEKDEEDNEEEEELNGIEEQNHNSQTLEPPIEA